MSYESGKCIHCEACVRIVAAACDEIGPATVGRGAEACPTGAVAQRHISDMRV